MYVSFFSDWHSWYNELMINITFYIKCETIIEFRVYLFGIVDTMSQWYNILYERNVKP